MINFTSGSLFAIGTERKTHQETFYDKKGKKKPFFFFNY